jgi:GT2 family glycosyltransferase
MEIALAELATATAETSPPADPGACAILFSVVTVTYARDAMVRRCIAQVQRVIGERQDIEYILVDNNPDATDRSTLLAGLRHFTYVKIGFNKGVSARNEGASAARGDYIVFVDDDVLLNPLDAFEIYHRCFREDAGLAIISPRTIDAATGDTPRDCFPHTNKALDKARPFKTFRFQGNAFALRRAAWQDIGFMSCDFLYGLEEIDYAYQTICRGWEILYQPEIWALEHRDPGGRLPHRTVQEMRLTNKMIISWKYMPARYLPINFILFSAYVFLLNRGRLNVVRSFVRFVQWVRKNPGRRTPIGPVALAYVRSCRGCVWK